MFGVVSSACLDVGCLLRGVVPAVSLLKKAHIARLMTTPMADMLVIVSVIDSHDC